MSGLRSQRLVRKWIKHWKPLPLKRKSKHLLWKDLWPSKNRQNDNLRLTSQTLQTPLPLWLLPLIPPLHHIPLARSFQHCSNFKVWELLAYKKCLFYGGGHPNPTVNRVRMWPFTHSQQPTLTTSESYALLYIDLKSYNLKVLNPVLNHNYSWHWLHGVKLRQFVWRPQKFMVSLERSPSLIRKYTNHTQLVWLCNIITWSYLYPHLPLPPGHQRQYQYQHKIIDLLLEL